ncbi:PREDICTED: polyhomeotic-like protein 1 isoform X1 [Acropora digitifera]|uniref:polyhomeotic-like protein 1 isoform X1 n=1 Tax=Acropora digitifera TaxID=70779 RepID=UPI00077B100A|nr:PREDICTED: polyhomeotic-like protein 1 isoform X1 [Acropora digitifera]
MEMVANTLHLDHVSRVSKRSASPRILTHFVEGFVIQESNFPFTSGDDNEELNQGLNVNIDQNYGNGDLDMEAGFEAESLSSNDEGLNEVFFEDSSLVNCEQCGRLTEAHHQRGPKRFCSTSCARRYSVSCSHKMVAFHAHSGRGGQHSSADQLASDRKSSFCMSMYYDQQPGPYMVDASIQVNEFDTVHPLNFDWTRNEVEPLWLYEHVKAAKWNVQEVAAFVKSLNGCSEYADSFVSQEIDGQALMLLREEHMVVAMHMKLGPALKIVANVNAMKREALKEHQ